MATLNIKDDEVHRLAVELARRTGETLTAAVKAALRERLASTRAVSASERRRRVAAAMEIAARMATRPILDQRTPDEILGYDESGLPR